MMADQHPLDAVAQQRGFPDYATWSAWHQKYQAKQPMQGRAPAAAPAPNNWLQNLINQLPSPFMAINRASDAYGKATGQ